MINILHKISRQSLIHIIQLTSLFKGEKSILLKEEEDEDEDEEKKEYQAQFCMQ